MTYKDRTFCISPNCNNECGRQLTNEIAEEAEFLGMLISASYFCDNVDEFLQCLDDAHTPNERLAKTMHTTPPWDEEHTKLINNKDLTYANDEEIDKATKYVLKKYSKALNNLKDR